MGPALGAPGLGGTGGFGAPSAAAAQARGAAAAGPKKGMQLGAKSKGASSILESLAKEEGVGVTDLDAVARPGPAAAAGPAGTMVISGAWAKGVPG
jgi:hypothetical protein